MQRFPIRFTGLNQTMALVGMVPSRCSVDLVDDRIHVRMGMWFDLEAARHTVRDASLDHGRVLGWGVHGWHDRWLVNGSSQGLVRLTFEPDQLQVEVTDTGAGGTASSDGAGHGIAGMRERAAAVGGTLQAGPDPRGGFRVHACLPIREAT